MIEADRLSNPFRAADTERLAGGVETDADGVPQFYHVADKHPGNLRYQKPKTPQRDLERAGALCLAEIERLKRAV